MLSLLRAQVQSLFRELGSFKLQDVDKKNPRNLNVQQEGIGSTNDNTWKQGTTYSWKKNKCLHYIKWKKHISKQYEQYNLIFVQMHL